MEFETIGYFKEYFEEGKFIGTLNIQSEDAKKEIQEGRKIGYEGRKSVVLSETIKLDNKRSVKEGKRYTTYLYPLNGKIKTV